MTTTSPLLCVETSREPRAGRWLHVVSHTDPRYGGLSSAVPALAATVASRHGVAVSMAAFCLPGEEHLPEALNEDQVTFWPTSRGSWKLGRELRQRFATLVREADGLHIHGLWEQSTAVACSMARAFDKPYVLSAHGMLEPWALDQKRLKKRIYAALVEKANVAGAACLHALTEAEAEQYRHFGAKGRVAVIPNAVNVPSDAHSELFLTRYPELRGRRLVLFLSRLHPKKGLDLLVEAWARVCHAYPDAHLVLAGPDTEGMHARLSAEVVRLGIDRQVCFTGMLKGAMKWSALDAAAAYVLPSYSEGLSMALLEAMGMGVPVIATRACNMHEITRHDTGWEIETSATALTEALHETLGQAEELSWAKGRNGARLIAERYSPARVASDMAEMYRSALGNSRVEPQSPVEVSR